MTNQKICHASTDLLGSFTPKTPIVPCNTHGTFYYNERIGMGRKKSMEWSFFMNDKGEIEYNKSCARCEGACKQSFRVEILCCPYYSPKERKRKTKEDGDAKKNKEG